MKKNRQLLTIEKLRVFPGFENYTYEMAKESILGLETLSIFLYELYQKFILEKENHNALSKIEEHYIIFHIPFRVVRQKVI